MNLDDLIANESIAPQGADVLRSIGRSGKSFLVHALPRDAGKTTVVQAILGESAPEIPRHEFFGTAEEVTALTGTPARGYLLVAEIGHRGRPGYLAGDEVPPIFDLVAAGYSLASSLHADSVEEVFEVLAANGVPASAASAIPYLIKIRMITNETGTHVRRVVDAIHQIDTAKGSGAAAAVLLYRWDGKPQGTAESWVAAPVHHHPRGRRP